VDARGMGVRTKIIPLMKTHNGIEPVFEATDDFLKTELGKAKVHNRQSTSINASLNRKPFNPL
jgi:hypothetical protein